MASSRLWPQIDKLTHVNSAPLVLHITSLRRGKRVPSWCGLAGTLSATLAAEMAQVPDVRCWQSQGEGTQFANSPVQSIRARSRGGRWLYCRSHRRHHCWPFNNHQELPGRTCNPSQLVLCLVKSPATIWTASALRAAPRSLCLALPRASLARMQDAGERGRGLIADADADCFGGRDR